MENFFIVGPFLIGMFHCLEPDHLVAVGNLVRTEGADKQSFVKGFSWGIGHSVPVLFLGTLYLFFNYSFQPILDINLELPVGVMLIILGIWKLFQLTDKASEKKDPNYLSFLSVGVVHGLAGTTGVVVLLSSIQPGFSNQMIFLFVFCLGLMVGMAGLARVLSNIFPLLHKLKRTRMVVPIASIGYGLLIIMKNF